MIEREKKITIGDKTFVVAFPNVGQIITLEATKQALTDNRYGQMAASGVASMYYALDLVDTISFFQVCGAEVLKYYGIRNAASVSPEKLEQFVQVYAEQVKPWFDKIFAELRGLGGEKKAEDDGTSDDGKQKAAGE